MKGERITKDMLSQDAQLGGAYPNPLAGGIADRPEYPEGVAMGTKAGDAAWRQYSQDSDAFYAKRETWNEHTQSGGKTFDFSKDGCDRLPGTAVPTRNPSGE